MTSTHNWELYSVLLSLYLSCRLWHRGCRTTRTASGIPYTECTGYWWKVCSPWGGGECCINHVLTW